MTETRPIRILMLEDNQRDADLAAARLEKAELAHTLVRVDTREDFLAALERGAADVILADYALPSFDGLAALELARTVAPIVPFIFVSGTLGEETAVHALRHGAADYILKHRLDRLVPAIQRVVGEARLFDERQRAAASTRALESRAHLALAAGRMSAWEFDPVTDCFEWSPNAEELLGLPADAFTGPMQAFLQYVHPDDVRQIRQFMTAVRESSGGRDIDFRVLRNEDAPGWLHFAAHIVAGSASGCLIGVGTDITKRRRTEEHLRLGQRLEALGRLAGGLAHEANNQMAVVLGFADFVLKRTDLPGNVREDVEQISRAAERTAAITSQLLAFSRQRPIAPEIIDPNDIITSFLPVLTRTAGSAVLVTLDLQAAGSVRIDRNQLEQVLLNLTINAIDAMPDGGQLTITSHDEDLQASYLRLRGVGAPRPGRYVLITITDTGVGMPPEMLDRIFEPFFTTKPVGKGTGLGLAAVYGIVKQADGYVWAYSELGAGTVIHLHFPIFEPATLPATPSRRTRTARGTGTILVVEDEASVRRVAVRTLRQGGYQTLEANDGTDALALLDQVSDTVDLVITDVSMPRLGGLELTNRIRAQWPELPVVLMSGYPDGRTESANGIEMATIPALFLQKPFTPERLLEMARAALHAGAKRVSGRRRLAPALKEES